MGRRTRKELQTVEAFEKALREEASVSDQFDLPLTVLALVVKSGWQEADVRRALDALRAADLVARSGPEELLVALPNTGTGDARVVEERLGGALPEATVGIAPYARGESIEDLLERARAAARRAAENPEAT